MHPAYGHVVRKRHSRRGEHVFSITGLPSSLRDDQAGRTRRYLLSMGIRTACFVLAVVALAVLHWTVVGWALVIAAVALPYLAVVMANATRSRGSTQLPSARHDEEPTDEHGSAPP
jgi:Flp pilus assembly protein TadB